jgi:hypothetical protein
MSKNKPLLAKDLIKILEKNPEAVIATSDYFGYNHRLYHPKVTLHKKDESFDPSSTNVEEGADFVNNKYRYKRDTFYIGHGRD